MYQNFCEQKLFAPQVRFIYLPKSNGVPQIMIPKEEEIRDSTAKNPTANAKGKNHIIYYSTIS